MWGVLNSEVHLVGEMNYGNRKNGHKINLLCCLLSVFSSEQYYYYHHHLCAAYCLRLVLNSIIIIIIIIISCMQGIYTYIPETNYVPMEYSVAAILLLLFMVLILLVSVLNLLH